MSIDPIVEELDQLRAEQMERFHFDFEAFYRDLKEQEKLSPAPEVRITGASERGWALHLSTLSASRSPGRSKGRQPPSSRPASRVPRLLTPIL